MTKRDLPADSPVLRFEDVDVRAGARRLLSALSLSVPRRGLFGLVGPNGAGKSTLVRVALALQPVARGGVHVDGRPPHDWRPRELARLVGYVPQHIHSHWDLTVREFLRLTVAPASDRLLEDFELQPLLARRFHTLSGGEQARAAIARAMAHQPALLLADEPTAHLDLPHQHALMRKLLTCSKHAAVLIVLHDLHLAARYCDQVAVLAQGRLVAQGPPQIVLGSDTLARAYDSPLRRLMSAGQPFFTMPEPEASP